MSDEFLNATVQNIIDTSGTPHAGLVGQNLTWAQRVNSGSSSSRNSPKTPTVTTESQLTDDYMAELASSKAELTELRNKLSVVEESKKSQQYELELKAEKQRHELELQMAQQKLEMERQSERQQRELETLVAKQRMEMEQQVQKQRLELETQAQQHRMEMEQQAQQQRLDFERQLADQRCEFELQSIRKQQQVQAQITTQINEGLRQHHIPTAPTENIEMATFMAAQTRQMQMLTDLFTRVMNSNQEPQHTPVSRSDIAIAVPLDRINTLSNKDDNSDSHEKREVQQDSQSNGKRTAPDIVDLTTADEDEEAGESSAFNKQDTPPPQSSTPHAKTNKKTR